MRPVRFTARIGQEGVNPYVDLCTKAIQGWDRKGTVPIEAHIGGKKFQANLMPLGTKRGFKPGEYHRFFLNEPMRRAAGKKTGDRITVRLTLDIRKRVTPMIPALARELRRNAKARNIFLSLRPSHQKEILRYLGFLKSEEALARNVQKVMKHLTDPKATWFGKRSH